MSQHLLSDSGEENFHSRLRYSLNIRWKNIYILIGETTVNIANFVNMYKGTKPLDSKQIEISSSERLASVYNVGFITYDLTVQITV